MSDLSISRFDRARPMAGRAEWTHLLGTLKLFLRTYRTRRALLELTPRELSDIGISRAIAMAEASRPPWDVAPMER